MNDHEPMPFGKHRGISEKRPSQDLLRGNGALGQSRVGSTILDTRKAFAPDTGCKDCDWRLAMTPELLELGRQVATDPTCRDMRIGPTQRLLTNVEMDAAAIWLRWQVLDRINRDGCCGGTMSMSGRCSETGRYCQLFKRAQRIERQVFHAKELV